MRFVKKIISGTWRKIKKNIAFRVKKRSKRSLRRKTSCPAARRHENRSTSSSLDPDLKNDLSELAISMEGICALHAALWQAVCHGQLEGEHYEMGFFSLWEDMVDVKDKLGKLAE